jgi:hypothetical protein
VMRWVGLTTAASSRGYGSGASARTLYTFRKAFSADFERFVRLSISVWYAERHNVHRGMMYDEITTHP